VELHGIRFTDEERSIIQEVGLENEDYAICAVFEHRNDATVEYNEEDRLIKVESEDGSARQTVGMITDVCESSDPLDRIAVGVSMLEVSTWTQQPK
jgi:hypothetical protein